VNGEHEADLDWAFESLPELAGSNPADFEISRLPGYTNHNFRLRGARADWVLRLPRAATNRFIDRAAEAHNQSLAHDLGIAPQAAWRNSGGVTLTATLGGSRGLRSADFESAHKLALIVEPFRRLHRSGLRFEGGFDLRRTLWQHYELLEPTQRPGFEPRMEQAHRTLSLIEHEDLAPAPSHRDPVLGNLLLETDRLWLIDWEYSAMASPYWDLAILCNEAGLDLRRSRRLLQAYCAGGPPMKESLLFDYRGLLKLLNDCWMAALAIS